MGSEMCIRDRQILWYLMNVDFALQLTDDDSSIAVLLSSLCTLLVLGDDLSRVDRVAVSRSLSSLHRHNDRFEHSHCRVVFVTNVVLRDLYYRIYSRISRQFLA